MEGRGISDKVTHILMRSGTDAANDLIAGRIDAYYWSIGAPSVEVDRAKGLRILPFNQKDMDYIEQKIEMKNFLINYGPGYRGIKGTDVNMLGLRTCWLGTASLDDEAVYTLLKTIFDHRSEWKDAFALCADFTAESVTEIQSPTPYHAGTVKFAKEKGFWTPAMEAVQRKNLERLGAKK